MWLKDQKMQRKSKNIKSQLPKVGFFFLIVGILIFISTPLKKLKGEVFEEMRLAIFQLNINENNDKTTISDINTENLQVTTENITEAEENDKKANYSYIGELSIPKIKLRRGFVSKESRYNNIEYNITIANESNYPDVPLGNFILMAHSGNAYISFFDKLYKLQIGDEASVSYNANTYNYRLTNIYNQAKTGTVAIYRNPNVKTLTLITCTHNDDYNQTIYIFEEI